MSDDINILKKLINENPYNFSEDYLENLRIILKKKESWEEQYPLVKKAQEALGNNNIEESIIYLEQAVDLKFEGSFVYDKLIDIYGKRNNLNEVMRILNSAIFVFSELVSISRGDRVPKLERYKKMLAKLVYSEDSESSRDK